MVNAKPWNDDAKNMHSWPVFCSQAVVQPNNVNITITIALNFVGSLTIDDIIDSRCCMSSLILLIIHLK
jgi:hypothetical protein